MQGDIVGLLDSAGVLAVEYKYDAWGKPLSVTGNLADTLGKRNPFRYRGYVYDEETGLYYLRSRYYNSEVGRFVNADALLGNVGGLGSHNVYAYCVNAPVITTDPDGYNRYTYDAIDAYAKPPRDLTDRLNDTMQKNYSYMSNYITENTKKYGALIAYAMANVKFEKMVETGGEWDLKHSWDLKKNQVYLFDGIEITYQDPGNIHFGYVGSALHTLTDLHLFAGEYQIVSRTSDMSYWSTCFDDPDDYSAVTYGYLLKNGTFSTAFSSYSLKP